MINKVADTVREIKAISYKMEPMRTEARRYLEEKDREMKGMQDRINLLCTGLVDEDAAVLGGSHAGNGMKRSGGYENHRPEIMESKWMKSEARESDFPGGGGAGFRFSVVDGFTQVWTDGDWCLSL